MEIKRIDDTFSVSQAGSRDAAAIISAAGNAGYDISHLSDHLA